MTIQDLRRNNRIMPVSGTRQVSTINRIARHHSATTSGDVFVFQNHWRSLGWITGGYHEIILRDGTVQLCYDDHVVTNGIFNHNNRTYHICLVGNSSFTEAQERAFTERARLAMNRFRLRSVDVLGHNEFSGHASNICPGINMNTVRTRLGNIREAEPTTGSTYRIQRGDTLSGIARRFNTTIAELQRLNNISNPNQIIAGNTLRVPSGQVPVQQSRPTIDQLARK